MCYLLVKFPFVSYRITRVISQLSNRGGQVEFKARSQFTLEAVPSFPRVVRSSAFGFYSHGTKNLFLTLTFASRPINLNSKKPSLFILSYLTNNLLF